MENIMIFLSTYGWQLALIALIGIIGLGALKYCNAFAKIDKEKRKPIYFLITVGFSVGATAIYLLVLKQFEINYFITIATAIYALNQTMYAIYETTSLRDLLSKIFKYISEKMKDGQ